MGAFDYGADLLRQHHERFDHAYGARALRAAPPGTSWRLGRTGST